MNAAKEILRRAFKNGFVVKVDDGDGEFVKYDTLLSAWKVISDVESASVLIAVRGSVGVHNEWMYVIPDLDPEETAANFSADGWIEGVWKEIMKGA